MAKDKYVYVPSSERYMKQRANEGSGTFDRFTIPEIPRYKMKDGENKIRIMPPAVFDEKRWGDEKKWGESWGITIYVHYGIGPDNTTFLCSKLMKDEDCPICTAHLESARDDETDLRPKKKALCYVIDREDEKAGPQIMVIPSTFEQELINLSCDEEMGLLQIDDPDEGYDISFSREGKGKQITYPGKRLARRASPLCDNAKLQDKWIDYIMEHPLPDTLKFYDEEYIDKVYRGKISQKGEAEDAEMKDSDRPARRRGKDKDDDDARPSRSRSKKDEEPEEDDDEDARPKRRAASKDDDDDDGGRPRRSKRGADEEETDRDSKKRSRSKEEDDDSDTRPSRVSRGKRGEDEDGEEEDKDERPLPTKSRGKDKDADEEPEDDDDKDTRSAQAKKQMERLKRERGGGDDDEDKPKRGKRGGDEDEDAEDEDARPKRRARGDEDDEEDRSPRRRARG